MSELDFAILIRFVTFIRQLTPAADPAAALQACFTNLLISPIERYYCCSEYLAYFVRFSGLLGKHLGT